MQDSEIPGDQNGSVTITPPAGPPGRAAPDPSAAARPADGQPGAVLPAAGRVRRWGKVAAAAAAGALVVGAGFGVFAASGGLSRAAAPPSAAIPYPPKVNPTFVEDDDDVGQDNQENILQATAPGLVQIVASNGAPVGSGLVITPSGKVLTSDQILSGAGQVTARFAMAGALFRARVIGTDPAAWPCSSLRAAVAVPSRPSRSGTRLTSRPARPGLRSPPGMSVRAPGSPSPRWAAAAPSRGRPSTWAP